MTSVTASCLFDSQPQNFWILRIMLNKGSEDVLIRETNTLWCLYMFTPCLTVESILT